PVAGDPRRREPFAERGDRRRPEVPDLARRLDERGAETHPRNVDARRDPGSPEVLRGFGVVLGGRVVDRRERDGDRDLLAPAIDGERHGVATAVEEARAEILPPVQRFTVDGHEYV